ncbi:MAG: Na/Pi cotransporter family protein, partial [Clostridiales bacterium]|nr:Na/Pi cotransporter family protein [Clostridiales bacterium]
MNVFSVLTLLGGLAMFLFGMNTMGDGLVRVSGGRLDSILERLTSNRLKGVLLGTAVTAVIQSSSATTVMVIGFVNSGIMRLTQAVGVIMGANIGTTVTSWILSLTGIEGGGFLLTMLKPSSFSPILAVIGIVLYMAAKGNQTKKDVGAILLGFAVLMFGMETMSGAVEPLADNTRFLSLLTMFSNPLLGVLAGAVLTAVVQSSSASIGILQALCATGAIPYSVAIPIIMGQNIGTCVTALISAVGAGKNAKRAAMIHFYFNLIGTIVFMAIFYVANAFIGFAFLSGPANAAGIAVVHSLFNIACCIAWFPFGNFLVKLATWTIPDRSEPADREPDALAVLDDRFLEKPGFAVKICMDTTVKMAELTEEALETAVGMLREYSEEKAARLIRLKLDTDRCEEALSDYLMKVSGRRLSLADSLEVSVMLQCIRDFERMADHAASIGSSVADMNGKGIEISDRGMDEFLVYCGAVKDVVHHTILAFQRNDQTMAKQIEAYEEAIDEMSVELRQRHVDRLRAGRCSMEAGLILEDMITAFEHVLDHCSYIGACMVRVYSEEVPESPDKIPEEEIAPFREDYRRIREKYVLPEKMNLDVPEELSGDMDPDAAGELSGNVNPKAAGETLGNVNPKAAKAVAGQDITETRSQKRRKSKTAEKKAKKKDAADRKVKKSPDG